MDTLFKSLMQSYGMFGALSESESDHVAEFRRNGEVIVAGCDEDNKGYIMFFPPFEVLLQHNEDFVNVAKRLRDRYKEYGDTEMYEKFKMWIEWGGYCPVPPITFINEMTNDERKKFMTEFVREDASDGLVEIGETIEDLLSEDIDFKWTTQDNNTEIVFFLEDQQDTIQLASTILAERYHSLMGVKDFGNFEFTISPKDCEIRIRDWNLEFLD